MWENGKTTIICCSSRSLKNICAHGTFWKAWRKWNETKWTPRSSLLIIKCIDFKATIIRNEKILNHAALETERLRLPSLKIVTRKHLKTLMKDNAALTNVPITTVEENNQLRTAQRWRKQKSCECKGTSSKTKVENDIGTKHKEVGIWCKQFEEHEKAGFENVKIKKHLIQKYW